MHDRLAEREWLVSLRKKLGSGPTAAMGNMRAAAAIVARIEEIDDEEKRFAEDNV